MDARRAFLALLLAAPAAWAQQTDPNFEHPNHVVTVERGGYTMAGLVTHKEGAKSFRYGVLLFPGVPGVMQLREEAGQIRMALQGNFLIRSRRHWLDDETLLVSVDAPSDQWHFFNQRFRETPRYGADVAALVDAVSKRFGGVGDWSFVGTSDGSVSAFHAARLNPALATRVILTASVFAASKNGPGLSGARLEDLKSPLLWVHHADDPCPYTQHADARRYAERTMRPLITVRGGGPQSGAPCEARSFHGFVGMEAETVKAMHAWIRTGAAPAELRP